jgi:alpha-beta hydrolase superfamily lysophospholipase
MERHAFTLQRERDVSVHGYTWQAEKVHHVKAVVLLAHGMAEHILRYEEVAHFLVAEGFIVYGHDHRGHGASVMAPDDLGFFADENGFEKVVEDMHAVTSLVKEQHPGLPIFLLGHSMGSFIVRRYIQLYGEQVAGAILSGTGGNPGLMGKAGLALAKWEMQRKGRRTPSPLMDKMIFGKFNASFAPARTAFDFLSRDVQMIDRYIADSRCGFICSSGFYADLIGGTLLIARSEEIAKIPRDLPVYLIAGDQDPVGNHGKGVAEVFRSFKARGMTDVQLTLYEGARHEVLNEINRLEVYEDILRWLMARTV